MGTIIDFSKEKEKRGGRRWNKDSQSPATSKEQTTPKKVSPLLEELQNCLETAVTRYEVVTMSRYYYMYVAVDEEVARYLAEIISSNMLQGTEFPAVPAKLISVYTSQIAPRAHLITQQVQDRWSALINSIRPTS